MVAYEREVDAFFTKSTQLLEAFPDARLTTKYRKANDSQSFITIKTYDRKSGAIVKFRTDKTVDLGRLLVGNAKLSAKIAGTIPIEELETTDVEMTGVPSSSPADDGKREGVPVEAVTTEDAGKASNATGGKKKKKKNKK